MNLYIVSILAVAYAGLFLWGLFIRKKQNTPFYTSVLLLVLLALLYDNTVLALGKAIGEGTALERLNAGRFWLHAACTPLLILTAYHILWKERFAFAMTRWMKALAWLLTLGLILYQAAVAFSETAELQAVTEHGVLHYKPASEAGIPIMVIIVTAAISAVGALLLFRRRWIWLALGILILLGGTFVSMKQPMLHNVFEWILMLSLLLTLRRPVSLRYAPHVPQRPSAE